MGVFWYVHLVSFTQCNVFKIHMLHVLIVHSFVLFHCIPLYDYTIICLSNLLFMNIWVCFQFGAMVNKAAYEHFVSGVAVSLG